MRTASRLLFIVVGFVFGLQLAPAWAFTTDQQEDICATASVIFCENYESRALGLANQVMLGSKFKNNGWSVSDTSTSVVGSPRFDGSKGFHGCRGALMMMGVGGC